MDLSENQYLCAQVARLYIDLNKNREITQSVTNHLCTIYDNKGEKIEVHLTLETEPTEMVNGPVPEFEVENNGELKEIVSFDRADEIL